MQMKNFKQKSADFKASGHYVWWSEANTHSVIKGKAHVGSNPVSLFLVRRSYKYGFKERSCISGLFGLLQGSAPDAKQRSPEKTWETGSLLHHFHHLELQTVTHLYIYFTCFNLSITLISFS